MVHKQRIAHEQNANGNKHQRNDADLGVEADQRQAERAREHGCVEPLQEGAPSWVGRGKEKEIKERKAKANG